jgi:ubiquinone biosynthesis protein COQ4
VTITRRVSSAGILKSYNKSISRQTSPHVHSTIFAATRTRTRRTCSNHTCPFSTSSSEPFYGNPRQEQNNSLSPLQSITLAVHSATNAFLDPERHDMVATLAEVTGSIALQSMCNQMMSDPTGQRILNDRPLVNTQSIDISKLANLPSNTFGYHYAKFLQTHKFNPNHRAAVKYIPDPELAYVMTRYRQSHDFFHVLTDLPPTIPGELALKYAELFQTELPICALSSTVGSLKLSSQERQVWKDAYLPWAIRVGTGNGTGKKWMNVYWEEEFERDLTELREELGVEVAPVV